MPKEIHGFSADAEGVQRLVRRLRQPDGCPWDKEQTWESLVPCLTGECAEVVEAIDCHDHANLAEELGDLLMNVVFAAELGEEAGAFTWEEVCAAEIDKMVRRHPHVFGDQKAEDVAGVLNLWQEIKKQEKPERTLAFESVYDKPIVSLSALDRATSVQKRAAKVGFDWTDAKGVMAKIEEECAELKAALASGDEAAADEELGDLLFSAVNLARFRKRASAETLLRENCRKFVRRFQSMEAQLAARGKRAADASMEELETCYQEAKRLERMDATAKSPDGKIFDESRKRPDR